MKKRFFYVFASFLICLYACVSVNDNNVSNDNEEQQTQVPVVGKLTNMKQFVDVNVVGDMKIVYNHENNYTVKVESSNEAFNSLVVYVKENELYICSKNDNNAKDSVDVMKDVKVYVSSPDLHNVKVTGGGSFSTSSPIDASHFDIKLTGSGNVGFSNMISSNSIDVNVTGSGSVSVADLKCVKLMTQVTGSGSVAFDSVNVEEAKSSVTGSGSITMKGKVGNHIKQINGQGKINFAQ